MGLFKRKSDDVGGDNELATELAWLRAALTHYPPGHRLRRGQRCMCPKCGTESTILLGTKDTPATTHRCPNCSLVWRISAEALAAHAEELAAGERALEAAKARLVDGTPLQVLVVEDDPADAKLIRSILAPASDAVQLFHAETLQDGIRNARLGFDAAIVDVNLPDSTGMATVRTFREEVGTDFPACFCTGDAEATIELRQSQIPVLPKHSWVQLLHSHQQGAADVLDLIIDAIEASRAGSAAPS